MTARRPCPPAPGPLEDYAARFDDLLGTLAQRRGFREYLTGPSERPSARWSPTAPTATTTSSVASWTRTCARGGNARRRWPG
ncbi:hypothetical protein F0L68_38615 [Solihabitans fulvus]|uniref:Uncharacterized protein n=1 Tax=Solihabitans fulvus TaxID=1892852 RepID=A0A5B2WKX7_9PSEU|nr:hypothetical protein F0L68_38615 [Solihabitans fulvus]